MAQLTVDAARAYEVPAEYQDVPCADNVIVYRGSAVGLLAGYGRQLVALDLFAGFAETKVDNTLTGHTAGGKFIRVRRHGEIQLAVSGAAVTDLGKSIYASDGNVFTLTEGSNSFIGTVERYISSGIVIVKFAMLPRIYPNATTAVVFTF